MAGHRGDAQVVRDALLTEEPEVQVAALGAALRLKILDSEMLKSALRDPAAAVRRRAAELAPRLNAERAAPHDQSGPPIDPKQEGDPRSGAVELAKAVVELLADDDCAEVAAFALGELEVTDPAIVEALCVQGTGHTDPLCRESAVAALGALGEGRSVVLAALDDVATVRRRAVIALANFDGDDIEAALANALDDRDWQVRQAAEDLQA